MQQVYFKETEFLTSTIDFNHQDTAEKVVLDIAYGVDQNFLFGCGISIASVLKIIQIRLYIFMFLLMLSMKPIGECLINSLRSIKHT